MPDGAGLPPATTPVQAAALAIYLTWLGAFADHDTLVTGRLTRSQKDC